MNVVSPSRSSFTFSSCGSSLIKSSSNFLFVGFPREIHCLETDRLDYVPTTPAVACRLDTEQDPRSARFDGIELCAGPIRRRTQAVMTASVTCRTFPSINFPPNADDLHHRLQRRFARRHLLMG